MRAMFRAAMATLIMTPTDEFREAMVSAGLTPPDNIVADGGLRRFSPCGDHSDSSGWYTLHSDGIAAGAFGDWRTGLSQTWHATVDHTLTPAEKTAHRERIATARKEAEYWRRQQHADARKKAAAIWGKARPARDDHPYLKRKKVAAHKLRAYQGALAIPLRDAASVLRSLQFIDRDGTKRFLTDGEVKGCYYGIGRQGGTIAVCEGYATGASIYEATGYAVACAMFAGNLEQVARALRSKFLDARIILCADDDADTLGNPGLTKATEAAQAVGGSVAIPDFGESRPHGATDFNDLHQARGLDAVLRCIEAVRPVGDAHEPVAQPVGEISEPAAHDDMQVTDINVQEVTAIEPVDSDAEVALLAALPVLQYERERTAAAEKLGIRTAILDRLVTTARGTGDGKQGRAIMFPEIAPWLTPVNGVQLLDSLVEVFRRHVVMAEHARIACALWIMHTYALDAAAASPILLLTSPERRCGKSTTLDVLARLVNRPLAASNITPAAIYRTIETAHPTLLVDELDSFVDDADALRGVLNSGHTRTGANVIRLVGDDHEPRQFSTWAPKALAMIGNPPPTILDRSIRIELQRRTRAEPVERLRSKDYSDLRCQLVRWTTDHLPDLMNAEPKIPDALDDRAMDSWQPLLAITEVIDHGWPERAREAALVLADARSIEDGLPVELLRDLKKTFAQAGTGRLASAEIVTTLLAMEDRPWKDLRHGKGISQNTLSRMLRPFGVVPITLRVSGTTAKGYYLEKLEPAFTRYIPPSQTVTPSQTSNHAASSDFAKRNNENVLRIENPPKPMPALGCDGVTAQNRDIGTTNDVESSGWTLEP